MSSINVVNRLSLGSVAQCGDNVDITPNYPGATISLSEYSQFKYGDLRVARYYGDMMAQQLFAMHPELMRESDIFLTASAYKKVKPASGALVPAFLTRVRQLAQEHGYTGAAIPFKIDRANLTDGDYAGMSMEERIKVMEKNGLSIDPKYSLAESTVVALDDICVTGSHERSIERVLGKASVAKIVYSYILDVPSGSSNPALEAHINRSSVSTFLDVIDISRGRLFKPNARLVKYVLSLTLPEVDDFILNADQGLVDAVLDGAENDGLHEMGRYGKGYEHLANARILKELLWVAIGQTSTTESLSSSSNSVGGRTYYHHDYEWTEPVKGLRLAPFRDEVSMAVHENYDEEALPDSIDYVINLAVNAGLIVLGGDNYWRITQKGLMRSAK